MAECLAKKRLNKPKTSIKPKLQRHKTNKLITEPAFLPAKYIIECCKNKRNKYKNSLWKYKK